MSPRQAIREFLEEVQARGRTFDSTANPKEGEAEYYYELDYDKVENLVKVLEEQKIIVMGDVEA